jgi:protein tyrosine phosphatase (PTP) superfamily phosphohydrolase (DUF442 family)
VSTDDIHNFIRVSDLVLTGGQPTEEQLREAAAEGVQAVINLAPLHPGNSLDDEGGLAQSLGMAYHHLPVDWAAPTSADFAAFEAAYLPLARQKTLIHCAANFRVTAFYALFAQKHLGWSEAEAEGLRARVWAGSDYPVWEAFVQEMRAKLTPPASTPPSAPG